VIASFNSSAPSKNGNDETRCSGRTRSVAPSRSAGGGSWISPANGASAPPGHRAMNAAALATIAGAGRGKVASGKHATATVSIVRG
jgi:hypothetical protein